MTGGTETNSEGAPVPPPGPADRSWAHPSEVGLATRGHTDRRRSSFIATGVVLGGLGLLLSGVLLGAGQSFEPIATEPDPSARIARSIASVLVVRDGQRSVVTGLVLDGDGHVLVPAAAVDGADEIWARCHGDDARRADAVASDPDEDVTVLRLPRPAGEPASSAGSSSTAGAGSTAGLPVILVHATEADAVTTEATLAPAVTLVGLDDRSPTRQVIRPADDDAPGAGRFVFDRSGRLLGLTAADSPVEPVGDGPTDVGEGKAPVLRTAGELLDAAHALIPAD